MDVTFSPALRVYAELWEIAGRRLGLALEVQPKPGILRLTHRVKSAH